LDRVREKQDSGRAWIFFERFAAMATTYEKESPLENVAVFLIFFGVILGFCGGVIAVWMMN